MVCYNKEKSKLSQEINHIYGLNPQMSVSHTRAPQPSFVGKTFFS